MKSDNAIMIRWGLPPPGRENRALEVLRSMTDYFMSVEKAARITGFQQFGYNTGPLHERAGFVILEGSREQISTLLYADDFREEVRRIALVTTNLSVDVLELGGKRRLDAWDVSVQEMHK